MGLCNTKNSSATLEKPGTQKSIITLWGDFFSPETRTIMSILNFGKVKYQLNIVDQFKNEHKTDTYLNLNPNGSVPFLKEDRFIVLGGY